MKKIWILSMLALLVGCSTSEDYNKDTKTVVCTNTFTSIVESNGEVVEEASTTGTMEDTFWVEEGLLVRSQLKMITALSEIEDVEEQLAHDMYIYENSEYEIEGLGAEKPYIEGDNYIWVVSTIDYANLQPFVEKGYITKDLLNKKGDAIIFDLYQEHFRSMSDDEAEKPVCIITK